MIFKAGEIRISLFPDCYLPLCTEAVNPELKDITLLNESRRVESDADSGRSTGGDDISGKQGHESAHVCHEMRNGEDQVAGVTVLQGLPVPFEP